MGGQEKISGPGRKGPSGSAPDLLRQAILFHRDGMIDDAGRICRQILSCNPDDAETLHLMGIISYQSGEIAAAEELVTRAVRLCPGRSDFRCSLGNVLKTAGNIDEAVSMYHEAIILDPDNAEACNNLGLTLNDAGRYEEAVHHLTRALAIRHDYTEAYNNLGNSYRGLGDVEKAVEHFNQAIRHNSPHAYVNLGVTLLDMGNEQDAIRYFKGALQLDPNNTEALNNLANAFTSQGSLQEAVLCFRKCLDINPSLHRARSNLLLALHYTDSISPEGLFLEHRAWAAMHALPAEVIHAHENSKDPDRKLRIGYLSPDFASHPVSHFMEPVLEAHDRNLFEVFCYSDTANPDHVTDRISKLPAFWQDTHLMSDQEVTALVLRDRIDILIDLAGHTANNRLMVFARKPAPVQAAYLGYPDTTGLETMDYRIVDPLTDPPGETEGLHTEELVRMPRGFLCYRPPAYSPAPGPLPALESGSITFGCFNKRSKITEKAICTWSAILRSIPMSRLCLKFKNLLDEQDQSSMLELFGKHDISPDRIILLKPIRLLSEHIATYNSIDIALDTFPYNGTTTTCEALWMGVPVIALKGNTHVSRVSFSILSNIGLAELAADTPGDYVARAVHLAGDMERLGRLRGSLRDMMRSSPTMDAAGFTSHLEAVYRMMWERWCHQDSPVEKLISDGEALFEAGQVPDAERMFRQVLGRDPGNIVAMNNLGVILWHTGRTGEAEEHFIHVLEIDPGFTEARDNLEKIRKLTGGRCMEGLARENEGGRSHEH